jgi:mannose-6-phosphate isomerase class I
MNSLLPMISLNVYLLPEFRRDIFTTVVDHWDIFSPEKKRELTQAIKEFVKISGFRNPLAAPQPLLVRAMEAPFEKESRFVKTILSAWAEVNSDLQAKIEPLLSEFGFETNGQALLYPDPDNAFLVGWPEELSFEKLADLLKQKSNLEASPDEISLMTVWLTGRLPGSEPAVEE